MNTDQQLEQIDFFESHYKYDASYARDMLNSSSEAYSKFSAFKPMSTHREYLSVEEYWVAKLAAVQVESCGSCLQLNIRMALEAGTPKSVIESILKSGQGLPQLLAPVYQFSQCIAANKSVDEKLDTYMQSRYNEGQLLELGMCVAAARVFTTIKRAGGYTKTCNLMEIEV